MTIQAHSSTRALRTGRTAAAFAGAFSMALIVGLTATGSQPAKAQASSGADYAVETYGDAWDYDNVEDQIIADRQTTVGLDNPKVANGNLSFDISGGSYFHMIWGGYPDSAPTNRDGALNPIDTSRFDRIVLKVNASAYTPAGLRWYTCANQDGSCQGGMPITLEAGTRVYDLPINSTEGVAWQGQRPISLRMIFQPYGPTHIDVDWIRLTNSGDGSVGEWSGPEMHIDDPDITGGADYATLARNGDAWDFSSVDDYLRLDNVSGQIQNGMLEGTNIGPTTNDPGVTMRVPVAFSADDFHRATIHYSYDGELNLEDKVGGGQNARLMWRIAGTPLTNNGSHNQVSRDLVMFPHQKSFTLDLRTNPSSVVVDPRSNPRIGWAGNMIEMFRFDPNEDRGARRWRIDNIKLADDDAGETSFTIKLRDTNPAPGTTVKLFADSDANGFDGQQISDAVDISGGTASVNWQPPAGTNGTFWIYALSSRGAITSRTYATGPLRMGAPVGKYSFGPATGGPHGQINFATRPGAPTATAKSTTRTPPKSTKSAVKGPVKKKK